MWRQTSFVGVFAVSILWAAGPGRAAQPVARVLDARGKVSLKDAAGKSRDVAALDTVYAGQTMTLAASSAVTLAFRADGHLERLAKPGEVTLAKEGCRPRTNVETPELPESQRKLIGATVKSLRPTGTLGATIVRAPPAERKQSYPPPGATVLAARPRFNWAPVADAVDYKVIVKCGDQRLWTSPTVTGTQIEYDGLIPLKPGETYFWEALAGLPAGSYVPAGRGTFTLATEEQKTRAAELRALLHGSDVACLTLAAAWYEENGLVLEALAFYERLIEFQPKTAAYYFGAARMNAWANRAEEADKALKKARELQPLPDKPPLPEWMQKE